MPTIITRRQAQLLRTVLRRAFGSRGTGPVLSFTADAEGLRVRAMSADAAIEYRVPGEHPAETLWMPLSALDDFAAKKDEPVELASVGKGRCSAQWRDGNVPQITEYDSAPPRDADKFPALPENFTENPPSLLRAFTEASETADPSSVRYALGCVRFRGEDGSLAATDGRQLLIQSGFHFPWTGDLLVPHTKVFASSDFASDQPVMVGTTKEWVSIGIGPWFVHLRIDEQGRFPKLEQVIRAAEEAVGVCRFSAADAQFLAETLPRLPVESDNDYRVTLDLNGQVIVRAKTAEQSKPTEVVLSRATWSGEPLRMNVNCRQLTRAVKLGLTDLYIFGDEAPVSWLGETCKYLSSPMSRECCIEPADDAIRIDAPTAEAPASTSPPPKPKIERKTQPVSDPIANTNGNGRAQANGHAPKTNGQVRKAKASQQNIDGLIEEATKLRTALHDLLHQSAGLVKALKQHRRQSRVVQTTLASLRQLKGLGV